jgi:hypothetical protein
MKQHYLITAYQMQAAKYQKFLGRLRKHLALKGEDKTHQKRTNYLARQVERLRQRLMAMQPKLSGLAMAAGISLAVFSGLEGNAQTYELNNEQNPFGFAQLIQDDLRENSPALGDIDNDGDNDLVLSDRNNNLYYFKNMGTNSSPEFSYQTGSDSPFDGLVTNNDESQLALVDIDDDGDLDLIAGPGETQYFYNASPYEAGYGKISYFKNTGTISAPAFQNQTGTDNPFPVLSYLSYGAGFAMADLDADGDLDYLIFHAYDGDSYFYLNNGTASSPSFSLVTFSSPIPDIGSTLTEYYGYVQFVDLDNDGDLDLTVSSYYNEPLYYKNNGTAAVPLLTLQSGTNNPFVGEWGEIEKPAHTFADLNNDELKDLVMAVGDETYFVYNTGTASAPKFQTPTRLDNEPIITFADIDDDGDLDMIVGTKYDLELYRNIGTDSKAQFLLEIGSSNPFNSIGSGEYSGGYNLSPTFADLDADGDLDLALGKSYGIVEFYYNNGSASSPSFNIAATGTSNPFEGFSFNDYPSPAFGDLDGDGDADLLVADEDGNHIYYVNNGTTSAPDFTEQTGTGTPFDNALESYLNAKPTFADVDGDGDLDMVVGVRTNSYYTNYTLYNNSGALYYYQNVSTTSTASFERVTGSGNPFENIVNLEFQNKLSPAFADLDNDGDLDLFVADNDGTVWFVENTTENSGPPTNVAKAANISFAAAVEAFPNPTQGNLQYKLDDAIGAAMQVRVLDLSGMVVYSEEVVNSGNAQELNLSQLDAGVYILQLQANGKTTQTRFVKQ